MGQAGAEGRPRYGLLGIFLSVQLAVSAAVGRCMLPQ